MAPPPGFLQVDVDGLWAVRACYGKPEIDSYTNDPCWTEGIDRIDNALRAASVPASFFIVGRDLELDSKRRIARKLLHRGHELANHSHSHRLGLTLETSRRIHDEIRSTDRLLRSIGAEPVGFRSPGYDIDTRILRALLRCSYLYDASILPTYLSPLLRLADAWLARRWDPNKRQFGRFSHGRAPRTPYFPRLYKVRKRAFDSEERRLLELPVGTTPTLHLPLTGAVLLRMDNRRIKDLFARLAERGRPVLLLLHAIDGVDCMQPIIFDNRRPRLGGFAMSGAQKEKHLASIVSEFARHFAIERADHYARRFAAEQP